MIKNILIIFLLIIISGCSTDLNKNDSTFDLTNKEIENSEGENIVTNIKVKINNNIYNVNIESNETAQKFISKLPLTLNMNELNGNEKYYYLDESLPNNPIKPTIINKGDIITIRGKGRFIIKEFTGTTRSGRTVVLVEKYV